jgi:hypothetical protein
MVRAGLALNDELMLMLMLMLMLVLVLVLVIVIAECGGVRGQL